MMEYRDIPVDSPAHRVRLELHPDKLDAIARVGHEAHLSVAAVCRLVMSMFARGETITHATLLREAAAVRAAARAAKAARTPQDATAVPKRPRGRPRKNTTAVEPPDAATATPAKKRPRGRPRKGTTAEGSSDAATATPKI